MTVSGVFSARLNPRPSYVETPFDCCVKPICLCVTRLVAIDSKKPGVPGAQDSFCVILLVAPQLLSNIKRPGKTFRGLFIFRTQGICVFLRFVRLTTLTGTNSREGFFVAAYELRDRPDLDEHSGQQLNDVLAWYRTNLAIPTKFGRSSSKGSYRSDTTTGLSWFKPTAAPHLEKAYELTALLDMHGYPIEILRTSRPGYLLYEDDYQIVAAPFAETAAG